MIWFLNAKKIQLAEIHCQLIEVYGEGVMNEGNMHKWCWLLNKGRTNVNGEAQFGRLSVTTEELKIAADTQLE